MQSQRPPVRVTTGNLNKAVMRNVKRFPEDFMFRLSEDEFKVLIFQNGTSSWGGTRKAPNAFTEQGVAMLSGILNSDRAISVNIQIMRIFTKLRQTLMDNTDIRLEIEKIKRQLSNYDKNRVVFFLKFSDSLRMIYKINGKRKWSMSNPKIELYTPSLRYEHVVLLFRGKQYLTDKSLSLTSRNLKDEHG